MFHLFTKIDSISTSELEQKLKKKIQLLDVRTPSEYRRGHIKGAKNIPLNEIARYTPATNEKRDADYTAIRHSRNQSG